MYSVRVLRYIIFCCLQATVNFFQRFLVLHRKIVRKSFSVNLQTVMVGDLNINVTSGNPMYKDFKEILDTHKCCNVISVPTRVTQTTEATLDLCITSFDIDDVKPCVLKSDVSDHFPIFCFLPGNSSPCSNEEHLERIYSERNVAKFADLVSNFNWTVVMKETDSNKSYNIFISSFMSLYNQCFPLKPRKKRRKLRKPWITTELYERIKFRERLFQLFLNTKDECDLREYKKTRNKLNKDIKRAKAEYYINKFLSSASNSRVLWDTFKEIVNKKTNDQKDSFLETWCY